MAIVETNLPLADILIETGFGIVAMNRALAPNNVGATNARVKIVFMASLQRGFDYARTDHSAGGWFTFWLIGGAGGGSYSRTELHLYNKYSENIRIEVDITFEPLANIS